MPAEQPHRISLAAATAIVVASMVGTGVFTSLGFQIASIPSGFPVILLWIVGGIVALCGALCYAELVAMMPRSGGEYHLLGRAYHPLAGFLAGWVSVTAGFPATAALMSMGFGAYVHGIWPGINQVYAALTVLLGFTALRLAGAKTLERFHITLTVLKVLLIVAFIGGALVVAREDWSLLSPKSGDMGHVFSENFATSLFWVMFAYSGWNGAAYIAGEMHRPKRNVPLALALGTLIVMLLYVGLNGVMLTGGDWKTMTGTPEVALAAAKNIFGEKGGMWMGALIAFGLLSSVNAMLWSGSSTLSVVGQDSRALCWLDARDRRGELVGAVLFMAILAVILIFTGSFNSVLNYIQALLELSAAATVASVIVLRVKKPNTPRPFRVPLFPIPPILFVCVSAWMLWSQYQMHTKETLWGLATLLIGVLLYLPGVKIRQEDAALVDVAKRD
ncbi:MAG: amino acid permease [Verrucomicrobia bacterium]|nr:amino acid permease [Verrucomicrobiota bacterium]